MAKVELRTFFFRASYDHANWKGVQARSVDAYSKDERAAAATA